MKAFCHYRFRARAGFCQGNPLGAPSPSAIPAILNGTYTFWNRRLLMVIYLVVSIVLLLLLMHTGFAYANELQGPSLRIGGDVEFKLKYAWGDAAALVGSGYTAGQADVLQVLSLNVQGQVTPGLSISANLDNRKDGNLQVLELRLDGDPIKGRFGGLSVRSENPYTTYSGRLRGLELCATFPTVEAGVTVGRVQGIAAKKTFRGNTAQEIILYEPHAPYGPSPSTGGFRASIEGMEYYLLTGVYDADFMGTWIRYDDEQTSGEGRSLEATLDLWNLGYLYLDDPNEQGGISAGGKIPLAHGQFVTVSSTRDMLALRFEIRDILRGQIQALIRAYNSKHGLSGSSQMRYPFIYESETEAAFLEDLLLRHAYIVAGIENGNGAIALDAKADSYFRQRLYDLGQADIAPGSVQVAVRKDGKFLPVETETPLVFQVGYDTGIIEFDFPSRFFDTYDGIRILYNYETAMGTFNLGLSIAEGSEKVYLNDVLLERSIDYSLDYELGILTIFRMLEPDDEVRVEYEYFRGPFGKVTDYKANFYGATVGWTPNDSLKLKLELAMYADDPKSAALPELTPTMPNTHTVVGFSGKYNNKGLTISGDLAISHDKFPFDDNRKANAANKISGIMGAVDAEGKSYIALAHNDGISVGGEEFRNYSVGSGLSSPTVRDVTCADDTWFFATDNGLTVFSAAPGPSGQNPFDYVSNWRRIYVSAGLPGNDLACVAVTPWTVWVGTRDSGLASADLGSLDTWRAYTKSSESGLPSDAISDIAYDPVDNLILVGSDCGVAALSGVRFKSELQAVRVKSLWSSANTVNGFRTFAATESGVYARADDSRWSRILDTSEVRDPLSIALWNGLLWIGASDGLYVWNGTTCEIVEATRGYAVTAVGIGPGHKYEGMETLWAGIAGRPVEGGKDLYKMVGFEVLTPEIVTEHEGLALCIASQDSRHYVDIEAREHTATGYAARANARYALGTGSIYGSYETLSPGFTKIGQASRQAMDIWSLGTQWPLGSRAGVMAEHSQSRTQAYSGVSRDEAGKEILVITNRIGGTVDIGPKVDVSYSISQIDDNEAPGYERHEHTLSVAGRQSFFDNRLSVGAGYETTRSQNMIKPENSYVQVSLRGDATLTIDALSISARYRKPVKTIDPGGQDQHVTGIMETGIAAQWSKQLGPIALRTYYRQTTRDNIATLKTFDDKRAEIRATLPALSFRDNNLTPTVVLKWDKTTPFSGQIRQGLAVQGHLSGTLGDFRTSTGVSLKQTEYAGIGKLTLDTEVFATLSSTARGKLVPQFDLRWKRSTSCRPDLGVVFTDSLTGTARAIWSPMQSLNNVASATYSLTSSSALTGWQKYSLSLQDSVDYKFSDKLTITGEALIRSTGTETHALSAGDITDLKGTLKGGLKYRLSNMWSLGISLGYHTYRPPTGPGGPANAITLETGLKASF
ncbi:MAG TPA: hypothetical protein GX721_00320 [Firmicutes bacterium]|nr:hypothetical protein [Bacillota bacterium]